MNDGSADVALAASWKVSRPLPGFSKKSRKRCGSETLRERFAYDFGNRFDDVEVGMINLEHVEADVQGCIHIIAVSIDERMAFWNSIWW